MANQNNIIGSVSETWSVVKFTVPSGGVVVGDFHKVEDTWGIAYGATGVYGNDAGGDVTIAAGKTATLIFKIQKIKVNKSYGSGLSISIGDALYLNITTRLVSATKGVGDVLIGTCVELDAAANTTWVWAEIDGKLPNLTAA
jgi:hypothetical protein